MRRAVLLWQLVGTVLVLVAVPSSLLQAALLFVWWAITFGPLDRREAVLFVLACGFFTVMNALALRQGIFAFTQSDVLGMPSYELFMWGFYVLHIRRMVSGPAPVGQHEAAWLWAGSFALCFAVISDPQILLITTAAILLAGVWFFHDRWDLAYLAYAAALGTLIEYAGVWSGQWHYPAAPVGGVPPWFLTMWAGIGLFLRRLVLPAMRAVTAAARLSFAEGQP